MRAFILTILLLVPPSGPSYAAGALAVDTSQGNRFGYSFGYAQQSDADRRAIQECNHNRCHVVLQFRRSCAAYAADQTRGSTIYGWGTQSPGSGAASRTAAQNRALRECRSRGGSNCVVRVWGCDP